MTQRNNILLIVKQQQGIDYNSLLGKVSSSYGSINSARAAISRALKDLSALGMLKKENNQVFITAKGAAEIDSEMKNKLLIKLNSSIKSKSPVQEINYIVEMLSTLIERGKQDRDLLKAAKGGTEFYISDLSKLKAALDKRVHNLQYLGEVLLQQISSLQGMNFNDSRKTGFNNETKKMLSSIVKESPVHEITLDFVNQQFLDMAAEKLRLKPKGRTASISKADFQKLLPLIEKNSSPEPNPVNIYLPTLKIRIDYPSIYFTGAFKELEKLLGKN